MRRCSVGKIENFDVAQKRIQRGLIQPLPGRHFDPKQQFQLSDYRDADVTHRNLLQALQNCIIRAFHDVGTRVRVQHIARHYGSRSCTGRSSIPSMKFAEATDPSARCDVRITWPRGQYNFAPLFPYEYLVRRELKLLGQADGLTPVTHEDLCLALHVRSPGPWHIPK